MIVKSTRGVEGWRTGCSGASGRTVRTPTGLLMIDLPTVGVPDHVDLLVLRLMPVLPLLDGGGRLLDPVSPRRVLQEARVILLLLGIVDAIRPGIGLPFLGHQAPRHADAFLPCPGCPDRLVPPARRSATLASPMLASPMLGSPMLGSPTVERPAIPSTQQYPCHEKPPGRPHH